jgi:hypothetical protein
VLRPALVLVLLALFAGGWTWDSRTASTQITWGVVQAGGADWEHAGYQAIRSIGSTDMREEFGQTTDVSQFDPHFLLAAQDGVRLMPLLNTYGELPQDPTAFAQFAADMAARYGPGGTFWTAHPELDPSFAPQAFELLNEPDWFLGWYPDRYARLVKASVSAARAVNPQARFLVYVAGLVKSSKYTGVRWVNEMFAAVPDLAGYIDALDGHPYNGLKLVQDARNAMIAHGATGDLWITELGWSTNDMSENRQAALIQQWGTTVRQTTWIRAFFYFQQRDTATTFRYGLWREDGTPKPAVAAYAEVIGAAYG